MGVSESLGLCRDSAKFTVEDVQRVVANCPKQRFALRTDQETGQLQIRANQGHSMTVRGSSPLVLITKSFTHQRLKSWN